MGTRLAEFLAKVGPEFVGRAQAVGDAIGSHDLDEIIENMHERSDWTDLDQAGFKKLHVNKLHKAVLEEQARRASAVPGTPPSAPTPAPAAEPAPKPALVFEPAQRDVPPPAPQPAARPLQRGAPAPATAELAGGKVVEGVPKLEKAMSTLPEDSVKEPKAEVVVTDKSRHVGLGSLQDTPVAEEEFPALEQTAKPGSMRQVPQQADFAKAQAVEQAARRAQLAAEAARVAAGEVEDAVEAANATVAGGMLRRKAANHAAAMELRGAEWHRVVQLMWDRDEGALARLDQTLVGPLLGKSGMNKTRIEARSGAKLVIVDGSKSGEPVKLRILGSWGKREEARGLIDKSLKQAVKGPSTTFYQVVSLDAGAERPGICYSRGKTPEDICWEAMARWGSKVQGTEDGDFLKLDPWYLPMKEKGRPILQRSGEKIWVLDNSLLRSHRRGVEYVYYDGMETGYLAKWGDHVKGVDEGDGWFKVEETWYLQMAQKGKFELRKFAPKEGSWSFEPDPQDVGVSNLTERSLRARVAEAIGEGSEAVQEVLVFEPEPRLSKERPHAALLLSSREMAEDLRARRSIEVLGRSFDVVRPDSDRVRRAQSSLGSEAPSGGASVAGSQNSHASVQSQGEGRLMTLLFSGIPEGMYNSESQRPSVKQAIDDFARGVLKDAPGQKLFSFSASFAKPRKAPHGGCWLNLKYEVENCRINEEDGKPYTLEAFKKLHEGSIDSSEKTVLLKWQKCRDAIQVLEKALAAQDGPRISIGKWLMDKLKSQYPPVDVPGSSQPKMLVPCAGIRGTFPGEKLSVQWMRAGF